MGQASDRDFGALHDDVGLRWEPGQIPDTVGILGIGVERIDQRKLGKS